MLCYQSVPWSVHLNGDMVIIKQCYEPEGEDVIKIPVRQLKEFIRALSGALESYEKSQEKDPYDFLQAYKG